MGNIHNGYKMMEVKTETFPLYLTGSISPSVAICHPLMPELKDLRGWHKTGI